MQSQTIAEVIDRRLDLPVIAISPFDVILSNFSSPTPQKRVKVNILIKGYRLELEQGFVI